MKNIFILLACIIFTAPVVAQSEYHASDYAVPGSEHRYSAAGAVQLAGVNFGETGAGYDWDFSVLDPESQEIRSFDNPDANGFKESYILMCIIGGGNPVSCLNSWNELAYMSQTSPDTLNLGGVSLAALTSVYDKTDQVFIHTMMAGLAGTDAGFLPVVVELDDHDTVLDFPLAMDKSYTSHGRYTIDLTAAGEDFIYTYDRFSEVTVDGYGSLDMPGKSYDNVLRLKREITISDTLVVNGTLLENPFSNQVVYEWYSPDEDMVLLDVEGYRIWGGFEVYTGASWMDTVRCLEPSALFATSPFFPALDPETGTSQVSFIDLSSNADQWEWDFGDPESGALNFSTERNPEHVFAGAGTYNVSLTVFNNTCSPVQSDNIILPVSITDTTTTGNNIYHASEIHVYPNPCSSRLNITSTTEKAVRYAIYDLQGIAVLSGNAAPGEEAFVDVSDLNEGSYIICTFDQLGGIVYREVIVKSNAAE